MYVSGFIFHYKVEKDDFCIINRVMVSTCQINPCTKNSWNGYNFINLSLRFISCWISSSPFHLANHICLFTFTTAFICKPVSNVMLLLTLKWTHWISLACLITMGTSECCRALNNQRLMKTNVQTQVGRIAFWACVIGHAWEGGTRSLWFIVWRCPRTTAVCCPSMP